VSAVIPKDCEVCLSAGSVNKWGTCEICGEEFIETIARIDWHKASINQVLAGDETSLLDVNAPPTIISSAGQDAA
jgi:hypothetical protein